MQEYLAGRLSAAGASVDVWEPDPAALAGMPLVPPGLTFEGRPQLIARKAGAAEGGRWSSTDTSTSCPRSLVRTGRATPSSRPCATVSYTGEGRAT